MCDLSVIIFIYKDKSLTLSSPKCPVIWSIRSWNCRGLHVLLPTLNPDTNTTYLSSSVTETLTELEIYSRMRKCSEMSTERMQETKKITYARQHSLRRKTSLKNIFNKEVASTCLLPVESYYNSCR